MTHVEPLAALPALHVEVLLPGVACLLQRHVVALAEVLLGVVVGPPAETEEGGGDIGIANGQIRNQATHEGKRTFMAADFHDKGYVAGLSRVP